MKNLVLAGALLLLAPTIQAAELAGVFVKDQIKAGNGESLVLNGLGLREKLWIDVYVGSLYLAKKSDNVTEILSAPNALRLQLDFIYKKVTKKQLIETWQEGFEKNQSKEMLTKLQSRMDQFYSYFDQDVVTKDQYILDYVPGEGTSIIKNNKLLGLIPGEDFKNALVEIWLGNFPAGKKLKKGMLGLD